MIVISTNYSKDTATSEGENSLYKEVDLCDEARKLARKRIAEAIHEVYGLDESGWPRIGMAHFIIIGQTLYEEGLAFAKYRPDLDLNDNFNNWVGLRTLFHVPYMVNQIRRYIEDGRKGFPKP
jgi:hypothetical protein